MGGGLGQLCLIPYRGFFEVYRQDVMQHVLPQHSIDGRVHFKAREFLPGLLTEVLGRSVQVNGVDDVIEAAELVNVSLIDMGCEECSQQLCFNTNSSHELRDLTVLLCESVIVDVILHCLARHKNCIARLDVMEPTVRKHLVVRTQARKACVQVREQFIKFSLRYTGLDSTQILRILRVEVVRINTSSIDMSDVNVDVVRRTTITSIRSRLGFTV